MKNDAEDSPVIDGEVEKSEESSDFNSLFLLNNDITDFFPVNSAKIVNGNSTNSNINPLNQTIESIPCRQVKPKKTSGWHVPIKRLSFQKPIELTNNCLLENKTSYIEVPWKKENKVQSYEKYTLIDSNSLLKSLKKTLQKRPQKTAPNETLPKIENNNLTTSFEDEKVHVKSETEAKDFSEKTQEDTAVDRNLKDSVWSTSEIEGLDNYFEGHTHTLAKIKLPITSDFLSKKPQNELLWNKCFEIESINNSNFLVISAKNDKISQAIVDLNVLNATEEIRSHSKYDWSFLHIIDKKIFNSPIVLAIDKISKLTFNVLMLNYEKLNLVSLYEDIYKILILYVLSTEKENSGDFKNISSIYDIYVTEYLDYLENRKKMRLWVVFEPFSICLEESLRIRSEKGLHFQAKQLLDIYKNFAMDLFKLNEQFGFMYRFNEQDIYMGLNDNELKVIDISFLCQIKNKIHHSFGSLNSLIQKMIPITDFQEEFRISSFFKSPHNHLDKAINEIQQFSPTLKIAANDNDIDQLYENANQDISEEETLYMQGKMLAKNYYHNLSNESYKKLVVKYGLEEKNDMEIRYKIGINFFNLGFFEKTKGIFHFIKENLSKDLKKTLTILVILAFIQQRENDLEGANRFLEEILNVLKKNSSFIYIKPLIMDHLGFINANLANNLSNIKKSLKLYNDALQICPHNQDLTGKLAIINGKLGNYDKSLQLLTETDQNKSSSILNKNELEKRLIFLENKSLIYIEQKNLTEAKALIDEARNLIAQFKSYKIEEKLIIRLCINGGVLAERNKNPFEALKEFKNALGYFKESLEKIELADIEQKTQLFGVLNNIAGIYLKIGDFEKCNKYLMRCEKLLLSFDPEKKNISSGYLYYNKGLLAKSLGKNEEAIKYVENALKIKRKFTEESNTEIMNAMKILFRLYLSVKNKEKSLENCEKICEILRKNHKNQAKTAFFDIEEMGKSFENNNNSIEAIQMYEEAIIYIDSEQITDSKKIEIFMKLANLYESQKNNEKNLEILEKLVVVLQKNREENVKTLIDLYTKMIDLSKKLKKDDLIKKFLTEVESLHVVENNRNLLKKVGGKLLGNLKGTFNKKMVVPMQKN